MKPTDGVNYAFYTSDKVLKLRPWLYLYLRKVKKVFYNAIQNFNEASSSTDTDRDCKPFEACLMQQQFRLDTRYLSKSSVFIIVIIQQNCGNLKE